MSRLNTVLLIVLALIFLAGGGVILYQRSLISSQSAENSAPEQEPVADVATIPDPTATPSPTPEPVELNAIEDDWNQHKSKDLGFFLSLPPELELSDSNFVAQKAPNDGHVPYASFYAPEDPGTLIHASSPTIERDEVIIANDLELRIVRYSYEDDMFGHVVNEFVRFELNGKTIDYVPWEGGTWDQLESTAKTIKAP